MKKLVNIVFYGNIFYGLCTVSLCIESNLKLAISLNHPRFYILVFLATVLFYGRIYHRSSAHINIDQRNQWYRDHREAIKAFLLLGSVVVAADILIIFLRNIKAVYELPARYWALLAAVPVLGVMYYMPFLTLKKLRRSGWLKPFIIGFVWAGVVSIFPVMLWQMRNPGMLPPTVVAKTLLFMQNFLFISALAIVFDIKDHNLDKEHNLVTYPALLGIKRTILLIIIPLNIAGLICVAAFNLLYRYPVIHTFMQAIPFVILLLLTKTLARQRELLFYLAVIDGLMLVKAFTGIASLLFLK